MPGDPRTVACRTPRFILLAAAQARREGGAADRKTDPYHYVVDSTEIVSPDKVEVLNIAARPEFALTSCFTFDYRAQRRNVLLLTLLVVGFLGRGYCHP
jgi:hypothetical protein